jgi:hypothetical protein
MVISNRNFAFDRFVHVVTGSPDDDFTAVGGQDFEILSNVSSIRGLRSDPHPFSYDLYKSKAATGFIHSQRVSAPWIFSNRDGALGNVFVHPGLKSYELDVTNEAIQKLISAIRASDFNLPVALGELRETAGLGKALLHETDKFIKLSRLLGLKVLVSGSRALASGFLTYKYGIKPLVSDIVGILNIQPRNDYVVNVKVRAARSEYGVRTSNNNQGRSETISEIERHNVKFNVRVSIDNPLVDLADRLNIWNAALTAWELIPLSFVADMFIDIGGTLDILGSAISMNSNYTVTGSKTDFRSMNQIVESVASFVDGPYHTDWKYSSSQRAITCRRTLVNSIPLPSMPRFSVPTGASQLYSCAALLRTIGLKF